MCAIFAIGPIDFCKSLMLDCTFDLLIMEEDEEAVLGAFVYQSVLKPLLFQFYITTVGRSTQFIHA